MLFMPSRTIPEFWKDDLNLNSLSWPARWLFYALHHRIDDEHGFAIGVSPEQPTVVKGDLFRTPPNDRISIRDISRWLLEIEVAACIIIKNSDRGWFGKIHERLWYRASDFQKGQPRYGPLIAAAPISQGQLPLGPIGRVPPARKKSEKTNKSKRYVYDNDNDNDSPAPSAAALPRRGPVGTRALSSGEDSAGPAAKTSAHSREDEALDRLTPIVGMAEMVRNRGLWITYYREDSVALAEATGEAELKRRAGVTPRKTWAALVTEEFQRIRDERMLKPQFAPLVV